MASHSLSYPQKLCTALGITHPLIRHAVLTWTNALSIDSGCTLQTQRGVRRATQAGCLVLMAALLSFPSVTPASAIDRLSIHHKSIELLKLYAHTQLMDSRQFHCLDSLWTRESHWVSTAKNKKSTAYGIPQILGMKEKDPVRQIDFGLKYIKSRYGTPCKAWGYWGHHGHY